MPAAIRRRRERTLCYLCDFPVLSGGVKIQALDQKKLQMVAGEFAD